MNFTPLHNVEIRFGGKNFGRLHVREVPGVKFVMKQLCPFRPQSEKAY